MSASPRLTGRERYCVRWVCLDGPDPLWPPRAVHDRVLDATRGFHGYYGSVRLLGSVHHRRASTGFPTRSVPLSGPAGLQSPGSSVRRLRTCSAYPAVPGPDTSRANVAPQVGFWLLLRRWHPALSVLSRLNTRPGRGPSQPCPLLLPFGATTRGSRPSWVDNPSRHGTFVYNASPACAGARRMKL